MTVLRAGITGRSRKFLFLSAGLLLIAGCEEMGEFNPFQKQPGAATETTGTATSTRLVERDVEAPDVFQVTDQGLWDGRPSLGGVWVAHPDVVDPERVIIRNTANNKFVIGALFRRERENPGPVVQVSSDAAAALGMLAGSPAELNVTALRRETSAEQAPIEEAPTDDLAVPDEIETTALDPVASAAAAIEEAEIINAASADLPEETAVESAAELAPEPAPAPQTPVSSLEKPFLQIGIFSVEENANNTATALRQAGMVPTVLEQSSSGKKFWRVIVGPAASTSERSALLKNIKDIGFTDAYPVSN